MGSIFVIHAQKHATFISFSSKFHVPTPSGKPSRPFWKARGPYLQMYCSNINRKLRTHSQTNSLQQSSFHYQMFVSTKLKPHVPSSTMAPALPAIRPGSPLGARQPEPHQHQGPHGSTQYLYLKGLAPTTPAQFPPPKRQKLEPARPTSAPLHERTKPKWFEHEPGITSTESLEHIAGWATSVHGAYEDSKSVDVQYKMKTIIDQLQSRAQSVPSHKDQLQSSMNHATQRTRSASPHLARRHSTHSTHYLRAPTNSLRTMGADSHQASGQPTNPTHSDEILPPGKWAAPEAAQVLLEIPEDPSPAEPLAQSQVSSHSQEFHDCEDAREDAHTAVCEEAQAWQGPTAPPGQFSLEDWRRVTKSTWYSTCKRSEYQSTSAQRP